MEIEYHTSAYLDFVTTLAKWLFPVTIILLAMVFWKMSQQIKLKAIIVTSRMFFFFFMFSIFTRCLWSALKACTTGTNQTALWWNLITPYIIQFLLFAWATYELIKYKKATTGIAKEVGDA